MIKKYFVFLFLFMLVGCQAPALEPFHVADFKDEEPVRIAVSNVEIEDQTIRYHELPHIETRIPMLPAYALKQALTNRYQAASEASQNTLKFVIQKADMIQKKQESEHWYVLNNSEFLLSYQVDVIYMNKGNIIEKQEIVGWEKQALPKRDSLAEKEEAWEKMLNNMVQKVTDKIQADMPSNLRL